MSERISWLDGWRGLACWLMLAYHLLFDFVMFGWMRYETLMSWPLYLLERFIAFSFILCAGISATLTRSNLRRGLITLGAGGIVTAASYLVDAPILFGILQFMGLAMLLYAALGRYIERLPEKLAPVLWIVLYAAAYLVTKNVTVSVRWLFWLGFLYDGFVSFDYFPLLPYIFLFLFGTWMGRMLREHGENIPILYKRAPDVLSWPGCRTLWIYLLHQPVLFGACFLVDALCR